MTKKQQEQVITQLRLELHQVSEALVGCYQGRNPISLAGRVQNQHDALRSRNEALRRIWVVLSD